MGTIILYNETSRITTASPKIRGAKEGSNQREYTLFHKRMGVSKKVAPDISKARKVLD